MSVIQAMPYYQPHTQKYFCIHSKIIPDNETLLGIPHRVLPYKSKIDIPIIEAAYHKASDDYEYRFCLSDQVVLPAKLKAIYLEPVSGTVKMIDVSGLEESNITSSGILGNQYVSHFSIAADDPLLTDQGISATSSLVFSVIVSLNEKTCRLAQPKFSENNVAPIIGYDMELYRTPFVATT